MSFQQGFGFEDPDDDVFSNMGLRSRLNRMGHPFDWPRKRAGQPSQPSTDPYEQYFDEVDFPHFGSTWDAFNRMGNHKRATDPQDRSGFFDYLPQEFRQYVPENFGFSSMRNARSPPQAGGAHQYVPPPQQQAHVQTQQHVPPVPPQPQAPPQQSSRSNLCDAAIQTEDLAGAPVAPEQGGANLNQHGLRNTTDLGQRTAQEEVRGDRAQSAPPPQNSSTGSQANAFASSSSTPSGTQNFTQTSTNGPNAFANAATSPQANFYPGQQYNPGTQFYGHPQAFGQQTPQFPPQYYPPPQSQFQNRPPPAQPQQPPQQQQPAAGDNFVRNVPIFVEGRNEPVVVKNVPPQHQQQPGAAPNVPPTPPTRQQQQPRPEPFTSKEAFQPQPPAAAGSDNIADEQTVPQTPHTADCIAKIQAIQRDVLELMCLVEQFGGKRGDKEYAWLDEMLTRNLLKLDTIDTNGKENIRLARKEAIKCIQASIAVLEAKADLDLNAKKGEAPAENPASSENVPEKMDVDVAVAGNSESKEPTEGDNTAMEADKEVPPAVENTDGAAAINADKSTDNSQPAKSSSGEQVDKKDNKA